MKTSTIVRIRCLMCNISEMSKSILGPEVHYNYIQSDSSVTHGKYSYKFHSGLCAWRRIIAELDSYVEREPTK